jgi:hypothetical protein
MFIPNKFNGIKIYKMNVYAENNLICYAVDCLRHNHSYWMSMPLIAFGITIQTYSTA